MNKIFVYLVVLFMTQSVILNFKNKKKKPVAFKWPNISILFFNLTLNILGTFEFFWGKRIFPAMSCNYCLEVTYKSPYYIWIKTTVFITSYCKSKNNTTLFI